MGCRIWIVDCIKLGQDKFNWSFDLNTIIEIYFHIKRQVYLAETEKEFCFLELGSKVPVYQLHLCVSRFTESVNICRVA
jgi:hypothetical protein